MQKPDSEFIDAIYDNNLIQICKTCSIVEDIPIVKRPTQEQIKKGDQRYTVRETMERISGMNKLRTLGPEAPVAIKHLGKIKFPEKANEPVDLVENYNWALRIARRRKKLTLKQISELISVSELTLKEIEDGKLPKNYESIIPLLESALGVTVRKRVGAKLNFVKPQKIIDQENQQNEEEEITQREKDKIREIKQQKMQDIKRGEFDFSDKKKVENLTLSDLQRLKKEREARENLSIDEEIISLTADDIEIDEDV